MHLDDSDQSIIDRLRKNARESHQEIGEHVHLSRGRVAARMERMEREGVILGYTVALNPDRIGSTEAYVEISFAGKFGRVPEFLHDEMVKRPQIREAMTLAGKPDGLVRLRVNHPTDLRPIVMELREYEVVTGTKTLVVIGRSWHGTAGLLHDSAPLTH